MVREGQVPSSAVKLQECTAARRRSLPSGPGPEQARVLVLNTATAGGQGLIPRLHLCCHHRLQGASGPESGEAIHCQWVWGPRAIHPTTEASGARSSHVCTQSKRTASRLRVARPTVSAKNKASFKASMPPKSQNPALAILLVPHEECVGEELELRVPPGPSQPCSWGGVNTQGAVRAVSRPHLPLPRVKGEQQRPEIQFGRRQAGWPCLRSQTASRPPLQPPTPKSALTPKAPHSSPKTALLNPLPSTPEASKYGLSQPIPGALSVFTAPTASLLRAHNKNQKPLLAAPGRHTQRGPGERLGRHCGCKDVPQSYGRTPETGPGATWYWAHRSPPGEKFHGGVQLPMQP